MTGPMAAPPDALAQAGPDGPDTMGHEIADGPDAVAATLTAFEGVRPRIATLLTEARRFVLIGTGASLAMSRIALPIGRAASPDGPSTVVRQSSEAALGDLDGLHFMTTDLVIATSQSGSSPETISAARAARRVGASVIVLTAHLDSPLALTADVSVELASATESGASTKSAMASLAGLLAIVGVLPRDDAGIAEIRDHLAAVVASWPWAFEPARELAAARHTWLLGFGAALGMAEAAALIWHEKVVLPATPATPSEFRHGLIEAATPRDVAVLYTLPGSGDDAARYLDRLRAELSRLGVGLIDMRPTAGNRAAAALELLLRTQQLARATALAAGTYRDDFAILRHVVQPADDLPA
jgi:glutamine---fructose-6-phosphate transaminase (isomerizing)